MGKYKTAQMTYDELNKKIQAGSIQYPKFQRNVVWGDKKIKGLIDTIQKGYPFGSILLYRPDENATENYKLIDGLQRYQAISKYTNAPLQYYPGFNDKFEILQEEIAEIINKELEIEEDVLKQLSDQLKQNFKKYSNDSKLSEIISGYKDNTEVKKIYPDILSLVEDFINGIKSEIKTNDLIIPVIYFDGNENELTDVFQRINEGGKPLTKYEIFASSWCDYIIKDFKDSDILNTLKKRYEKLEETIGELSFDFEYDDLTDINVFEYCFSTSKIIAQKISKNSSDEEIDTIGFTLFASALSISAKDIRKIGVTLSEWSSDNLIKLKDILVECTEQVIGNLRQQFSYNKNYFVVPNDFQLISYIATILKLRYTISLEGEILENKRDNSQIESAFKGIECDILLNIFENNWGNAGDTKLDTSIGINSDNKLKYLKHPNKSDIIASFDLYMKRQNETDSLAAGVKSVDKMLLAYLLNKEIAKNGNIVENNKIDIEHIVTQKILKDNEIRLISPLCNLCFLPHYENRAKKDKIIYDFIDESKLLIIDEKKLLRFLYPTREELQEIIQNQTNLDLIKYRRFLENRKEILKKAMANSLPLK